MKTQKKSLSIVLAVVAVLLVAVIVVVAVVLSKSLGAGGYEKKIQIAEQCLAQEDYDGAISAYYAAIDVDDSREEAYLGLAEIYEHQGNTSMLNYILSTGSQKTNSDKINDMLARINQSMVESKTNQQQAVLLNETMLQHFAYDTYSGYQTRYNPSRSAEEIETANVNGEAMNQAATVRIRFLSAGVALYFEKQPQDTDLPAEVHVDDLKTLFSGMDDGLTYTELQAMDLTGLEIVNVPSVGSAVFFQNLDCNVWIASDQDGNIQSRTAWNCITPVAALTKQNEDQTPDNYTLLGTVKSATTGQGVEDAEVTVYDIMGNVIAEYLTDADGHFSAGFTAKGGYEVSISATGYMDESQDIYLDQYAQEKQEDFIISPLMQAGQIRIVLSWGATPWDLDAHCLFENGGHVCWYNRSAESSSGVFAELDVDDTNGYGPETITVNDISEDFLYYVDDYLKTGGIGTSGAKVKIYVAGNDPIILEPPADAGNGWDVFEVENGQVKILNKAANRTVG